MIVKIPITSNLDARFKEGRTVVFKKTFNIDHGDRQNHDLKVAPFELAFFPFFRKTHRKESNDHKKFILWINRMDREEALEGEINKSDVVDCISLFDSNLDIIGKVNEFNPYNGVCVKDPNKKMDNEEVLNPHVRHTYKEQSEISTKYLNTEKDVLLLEIKTEDGNKATLLPLYYEVEGEINQSFKYAVDFGTSNTHIEYMPSGQQATNLAKPFEVNVSSIIPNRDEKSLVVLLHKYEDQQGKVDSVYQIMLREFIPAAIGSRVSDHRSISFPTRTVVMDYSKPGSDSESAFKHTNIAFKVGEVGNYDESAILTSNLKWLLGKEGANRDFYKFRIASFFEQLFYMIKYKALMDKCKPNELEIRFTRPTSMQSVQTGTSIDLNAEIKEIIGIAKNRVFKGAKNEGVRFIYDLDEALAPVEGKDIRTASFVNMDIGGGTTDILFKYEDKRGTDAFYSSSIKFAGNVLWGNDCSPNEQNGMIRFFEDCAEKKSEVMEDVQNESFTEAYNNYLNIRKREHQGAELVSVLFKNKELGFLKTVFEVRDFKLLPFVHYASLIFYIANVEKKYNVLGQQTVVLLSGNGSKYVRIFTEEILDGLSNLLYMTFTEDEAKELTKVMLSENPKEATAKGALLMNEHRGIEKDESTVTGESKGKDRYKKKQMNRKKHQPISEHLIETNVVESGFYI